MQLKFENKQHELEQIEKTIDELKRALDDMYRYRAEIMFDIEIENRNSSEK